MHQGRPREGECGSRACLCVCPRASVTDRVELLSFFVTRSDMTATLSHQLISNLMWGWGLGRGRGRGALAMGGPGAGHRSQEQGW